MNVITKTVSLPDGRTITIETGKLAKQADGAVMLRMGNTISCRCNVITEKDIRQRAAFPEDLQNAKDAPRIMKFLPAGL